MARRTLRWERHLALRGLPHVANLGCGLRQLGLWLVDNLFLGRLCIACTRWTVATEWHWGWHERADCTRTMQTHYYMCTTRTPTLTHLLLRLAEIVTS